MTIAEVESRARLLYFLENNLTVTASPAGSDTYIQFNDDGSMGADANLTWDASTLAVGGALTIAGNTTLGDASGDSVTINAETIDLANVAAGTDNTVLVYNGSSIVTDEIDSKVWAGALVDYTGTPADNQVAIWTDTDTLEGDSNFTWDGSAAATDEYLNIKNTVDDGTTNRTMVRLYNYRADDADVNDFGPISIDFEIHNVGGNGKSGIARMAAVQCPVGTDHTSVLGEKTSGLIFSTMNDDTLAEAMRINAEGYVGIGTTDPATALDIHHDPTGLSDDTGGGEVVTFGTEDGSDTLAAGRLMYLNDSGVWKYADGDAASTGGSQLLAIALGTAVSDGLLLRGFFDMATYFQGSFDQGVPLYVSTTAGSVDVAAPSATGDFVRVVGYCTDTANVVYFNPDGTYIEIS